jgi:hypothetical protein
MADATLSQYDQDFSHAMALKLKLNREQRSKDTGALTQNSAQFSPTGGLRNKIAQEVISDHPSLTQAEVLTMMERDGF